MVWHTPKPSPLKKYVHIYQTFPPPDNNNIILDTKTKGTHLQSPLFNQGKSGLLSKVSALRLNEREAK